MRFGARGILIVIKVKRLKAKLQFDSQKLQKRNRRMPRLPTPRILIIGDETIQAAMPRVTFESFRVKYSIVVAK
jgi:hypothetical protein